jgi:hypothetical protein
MRSILRTTAGFLAVAVIVFIPVTAQASTSATAHVSTYKYVDHTVLPSAPCATLRHELRDPSASCAITETLSLTAIRTSADRTAGAATPDTDTYWIGYLQACAVLYSNDSCDPNEWWAYDDFDVVTNGTDAWNYDGAPRCAANHTDVTWCSYVDNGTPTLSEGFNFGSGGYARLDAEASGAYYIEANSWANPYGYIEDVGNS